MKRSLWQSEDGTALMECALVMPLLVFLIFMLIQLSLVCMARQVVHYAAYSAARATLVYHPNEFGGMVGEEFVFYEKRGVAFQAACQALAWVAQVGGGDAKIAVPDWGELPASGFIRQQVSIDSANSAILSADQTGGKPQEHVPAVKVTVRFHYPLHIPMAGNLIAYFAGGGDGGANWNTIGLTPTDMESTLNRYYKDQGSATLRSQTGLPFITLTEAYVLPRLWDTASFPRAERSPYLGTEGLD